VIQGSFFQVLHPVQRLILEQAAMQPLTASCTHTVRTYPQLSSALEIICSTPAAHLAVSQDKLSSMELYVCLYVRGEDVILEETVDRLSEDCLSERKTEFQKTVTDVKRSRGHPQFRPLLPNRTR
jgi:hypothetical protein